MQFGTIDLFSKRTKSSFPLTQHAAEYWVAHARSDDGVIPDALDALITQLLEPNGARFINWVQLHDIFMSSPMMKRFCPPPLVYASALGLEKVSRWLLLEKGQPVNNSYASEDALHSASSRGHETIVRLLLENGADVNSGNFLTGTALLHASLGGHEAVVRLLLANGAEINANKYGYGTALNAASGAGHEAVVRLLLENGANVGNGDIELARHHEAVLQFLLENAAESDSCWMPEEFLY
jgi:hypothetical protein